MSPRSSDIVWIILYFVSFTSQHNFTNPENLENPEKPRNHLGGPDNHEINKNWPKKPENPAKIFFELIVFNFSDIAGDVCFPLQWFLI